MRLMRLLAVLDVRARIGLFALAACGLVPYLVPYPTNTPGPG